MKISVIIPTYNRENLIDATLKSVAEQTHKDIELIIIDNYSDDKTFNKIQDFKRNNRREDLDIRIFSETKPGACAARNAGIKFATSKWITFFDSDDIMDPHLLENYARKIEEAGDDIDIIVTKSKEIYDDNRSRTLKYFTKKHLAEQIMHSFLYTNAYIINKHFLKVCGIWDENLVGWNDWELGIRILLNNPRFAYINKILITKHTHADSITGDSYSEKLDVWLKSIETAEKNITESDLYNKEYYLLLIAYKRLALAGLCKKEKSDKSLPLYRQTMESIKKYTLIRPVFAFLYRYVSWGGHGGSFFAEKFIRLATR